ncbi:beta-2-glycoprotein 1-like [Brienomyrus brachyistius]|uniref:beta-2-glycoprotein 1-like n=1 Tax=Brienomyrus brachyistius TaxID=42636 RepID=UPI0020B3EF02|nr:beta-2-glycoprotein 1-like [Brienomyrus brachyistius]
MSVLTRCFTGKLSAVPHTEMLRSLLLLLLCQLSTYMPADAGAVCGRPPLTNDMDPAGFQRVYEVGQEIFLSCKPGYTPSKGSRRVVCTASGKWTNPTLKCEPKSCSVPERLQHGDVELTDITFRSIINYTCHDGYVQHGANTSECLADGTWSEPPPFCEPVTCGLPEIPKHGKIIYSKPFQSNTTVFGDSVTYECMPPFALLGNARGSCTASGNWTETPECHLVTCPVPPSLENGFISFSIMKEHGYKERVKYGCNIDYVLDGPTEIECEKTGKWSPLPICKAPCRIGIHRGRIFYDRRKIWIEDLKPNKILHGERLAVYCKNAEKNCGYPVPMQCIDGTAAIPECYEEPSAIQYNLHHKKLPSEIKMCT